MNIINPATESLITTLSPDTAYSIADKVQQLKRDKKSGRKLP
jgi:hypothetical protein